MGFFKDLVNYLAGGNQQGKAGGKPMPPQTPEKPRKPSAFCNNCGKGLSKGDTVYQCGQCNNLYCKGCGYMYTDPKTGRLACEICNVPLNYTTITW